MRLRSQEADGATMRLCPQGESSNAVKTATLSGAYISLRPLNVDKDGAIMCLRSQEADGATMQEG